MKTPSKKKREEGKTPIKTQRNWNKEKKYEEGKKEKTPNKAQRNWKRRRKHQVKERKRERHR